MVGLCRLCASLRKIDVLINLRDNSNEICDKLRKCCQLNISMDDGLPKSICQECISNLNNSYKFYIKVQESQETLQALYPFQGNKSVHRAIPQTLSAQDETLKSIRSEEKLVELSASEVDKNTKLGNQLTIKIEKLVHNLKTEAGKDREMIERDAQEIKASEKSISQDSYEMLESIEDVRESLEADRSPLAANDENEQEADTLDNQNVEYDLVIADEKDANEERDSNEVIQQINDLLSDDEVNVEIEYLEDEDENENVEEEEEEEDYADTDEPLENASTPTFNSCLFHDIKISSWKNYKYLCFLCDQLFSSFIDLSSHAAREHDIKPLDNLKYKCYDCRKIITRYSFFLNHVRTRHHPDLKLRCDACDLSCQNYDELTCHRSDNCEQAKHLPCTATCTYCFKSFNNVNGLQNHVKFQHISSSKATTYKCQQCDKEFQYKSCLKSHELLHSDTKQFSCDYCDKSFHTKLGLEQHLYAHVEEKVFLCNICLKSYKTPKNLDDHRKLHTEEKAFKCQFCSKAFSRKIQKLTHERSHTGEQPYSCVQCDKKFRYRSALFAHNKIHTGHKPYSCDYCEKTFADSSNRNKHVRRMHLNNKRAENKSE